VNVKEEKNNIKLINKSFFPKKNIFCFSLRELHSLHAKSFSSFSASKRGVENVKGEKPGSSNMADCVSDGKIFSYSPLS
jgi:hypothetical protein